MLYLSLLLAQGQWNPKQATFKGRGLNCLAGSIYRRLLHGMQQADGRPPMNRAVSSIGKIVQDIRERKTTTPAPRQPINLWSVLPNMS